MEIWDVLSRTAAIEVLYLVCSKPGSNQDDIVSGTQRNSKLRRLQDLTDIGLIEKSVVSRGRTTVLYSPTPEGDRVCRLLLQIRDGSDPKTDIILSSSSEDRIKVNR